jgi:hypothetical protein
VIDSKKVRLGVYPCLPVRIPWSFVLGKNACLCRTAVRGKLFRMTNPYPGVDMNDELAALKALYPNLSPEELVLAKENLDRYLSLAWEIYEDSRPAALSEPASVFPQSPSRGSIQVKVDSQQT